MPAYAKQFIANIPQYVEDLNNGQSYLAGDITIQAIAWVNTDGSLKCIDINFLKWKGHDITKFISECQPDTWEQLKEAARSFYLTPSQNVTS